jgi:sec-independent protein translocase protein TatC
MIVAAVALAAVLTPPDVVSQLMLAVPLILLYELSLVAMWFTDRRAMKEAALPQNNQAGSDPA